MATKDLDLHRFLDSSLNASKVYTLSVYTLGDYTLGVYSLQPPILDMEDLSLAVYKTLWESTLGVYRLGSNVTMQFLFGSESFSLGSEGSRPHYVLYII